MFQLLIKKIYEGIKIVSIPFTIYVRTLCNRNVLAMNELLQTLHNVCIRCMHLSDRISSLKNSVHAYYSDATEIDPNYRKCNPRTFVRTYNACLLAKVKHDCSRSYNTSKRAVHSCVLRP